MSFKLSFVVTAFPKLTCHFKNANSNGIWSFGPFLWCLEVPWEVPRWCWWPFFWLLDMSSCGGCVLLYLYILISIVMKIAVSAQKWMHQENVRVVFGHLWCLWKDLKISKTGRADIFQWSSVSSCCTANEEWGGVVLHHMFLHNLSI